MIIPGIMQATLTSFYGDKSSELETFIFACQNKILGVIGASFLPYPFEQVHATIIGLEGFRITDKIKNGNFESNLAETRLVDPSKFLQFVRSDDIPSIDIKIGGYQKGEQRFKSRNEDPYNRSFSIQGDIVVAMGWPTAAPNKKQLLDEFRRKFNNVNILHKWHRTPAEIDDDFYFVLGRIQRLKNERKMELMDVMRKFLATEVTPITVKLDRECLSVVGYLDTQLPRQTSCAFPVMDAKLTSDVFLGLYPTA
jgi:hypothetical protein